MTTVTKLERCDVAYSLIVDPEAEQILLVGHRDGYWSLPGGLREPGETLAETAIRETMAHWPLDFALHNEYRAFYHAAE